MAFVIRHFNDAGGVQERFANLVHALDTTAKTLMAVLATCLEELELPFTKMRGQCYDGASNMRGYFNRLKALVLKKKPNAFYVHYFAHRLSLVFVDTAKSIPLIDHFLEWYNRHVSHALHIAQE